jgi:hypothetical protein
MKVVLRPEIEPRVKEPVRAETVDELRQRDSAAREAADQWAFIEAVNGVRKRP